MAALPLQFLFKLSGYLGFQPGSLEELTENQMLGANLNLHQAFAQMAEGAPLPHWSRQERLQLMTLFLTFFQWHVEGFKSLQTIDVLREVLN